MATTTPVRDLNEARAAHGAGSMQLVSFRLDKEEYGIEITEVREIILAGTITRVPESPAYVKGLINLRSTVIPIVDLRLRFGMPAGEATDATRVIVVSVGRRTIGVVVDAVNEVLRVSREQIAEPPESVAGIGQEFLTGLVKLPDRMLILLDLDRVFRDESAAACP